MIVKLSLLHVCFSVPVETLPNQTAYDDSLAGIPLWWSVQLYSASTTLSGIEITTASDNIASSSFTSLLGASGILAVYATVVLAVGSFARDKFGSPTERKQRAGLEL